jgi:hexosaminidase
MILFVLGCKNDSNVDNEKYTIIPIPKDIAYSNGYFNIKDTLTISYEDPALKPLFEVLVEEFKTLYLINLRYSMNLENADLALNIDTTLADDAYMISVKEKIEVKGGTYSGVAMGTVSLMQAIQQNNDSHRLHYSDLYDYPDFPFRGLMVDVARRIHSIETLKMVVSLCRWYKIRYLQLHLTDEKHFTFPSSAYPQLVTENFSYEKEELAELIDFANARGVELIPELEVPGHAGQFIEKIPDLFGFNNKELNRQTINMTNEQIYPVLDTLIREIATLFHSSQYIHIGGDEPNFSGMDQEPAIRQYLESNDLNSIEDVYWMFINRMHNMVQKAGKQTIVWEGFSEEGNSQISKDIVVMAWETMYQLPTDLLNAGFNVINVSWKPLYVVNSRKWNPEDILSWNVYQWQNWIPSIPSYDTIQIAPDPGILGAGMASWDQPEFVEISSLRRRVPAMSERVWNIDKSISDEIFLSILNILDSKFSRYLSPVQTETHGLMFPDVSDGRRDEQTWFDDTLTVKLKAPDIFSIRFTTNGQSVSDTSSLYVDELKFFKTTTLKYQAFTEDGHPVGHEIMSYYELKPLNINLSSDDSIADDDRWERVDSWNYHFDDIVLIHISSQRNGVIRFEKGNQSLTSRSTKYTGPIVINNDEVVKAGLYRGDSLIGSIWSENFKNVCSKTNE